MDLAYKILGVLHFAISFMLVASILLQKTSGSGLFTSSGFSGDFMSSAEVANTFTKITKYLGILFLVNTLALSSIGMRIGKRERALSTDSLELIESAASPDSSQDAPDLAATQNAGDASAKTEGKTNAEIEGKTNAKTEGKANAEIEGKANMEPEAAAQT